MLHVNQKYSSQTLYDYVNMLREHPNGTLLMNAVIELVDERQLTATSAEKQTKKMYLKKSHANVIFMSSVDVKTRLNCTKMKIICKCKLEHDHART